MHKVDGRNLKYEKFKNKDNLFYLKEVSSDTGTICIIGIYVYNLKKNL